MFCCHKAYESENEEGGHEAKPPEPAKVPLVLTNHSEAPILLALPELSTSSEFIDTLQLETGIVKIPSQICEVAPLEHLKN